MNTRPMWLVLCEDDDSSARWAYSRLASGDVVRTELLLASTLTPSLRWIHRVGPGHARTEMMLSDGTVISTESVQGVFNRLTRVPYWCGQSRIADEDWAYGRQEIAAFFLSWMTSFACPVLNRASPRGLSGDVRHSMEWNLLASAAGFEISDCLGGVGGHSMGNNHGACSSVSLIVVGDNVIGCPARDWIEPCRKLAKLAGAQILGIDLRPQRSKDWTFHHATTHPDLRAFGDVVLTALKQALQGDGLL
jgi:hypothetical protein